MGYVFYSSKGKTYIGSTDGISTDSILSPYNYFSQEEQSLYRTSIPFSIALTSIDPNALVPYRLTVLSPDYYLYTELEQNEYKRDVLNRGLHMHNTYEIEYILEGEFYQQIEAQRYKYTARGCCLLNRNIRHREEYNSAYSTVILSLSYDFLKSLYEDPFHHWFPVADTVWKDSTEMTVFFDIEMHNLLHERKSFINFTPVYEQTESNDTVHKIFDSLAQLTISPVAGSSYSFRALICQLLAQLGDSRQYSTALINLGTETESRIYSQITKLVEETHGRISRTELSERLNYSGNYLNRIVRKYSGMNINQYGNYFAMQQASRRLLQSGQSISEICAELGFTDRTHFYRLFREEFGMTPKEYRENERKK